MKWCNDCGVEHARTNCPVVRNYSCNPADGCNADTIKPYIVTDHAGVEYRVQYCNECAELARVDWNGETARIRSGSARHSFCVTFEKVTEESAAEGDASERGYVIENTTLGDAVNAWNAEGLRVEADSWPCDRPRWLTVTDEDGSCNFYGESESRSLHIPEGVTRASARRIARLFGVKVTA